MSKYIDSEKLIAEIHKHIGKYDSMLHELPMPELKGKREEAFSILTIVESLQQEQEEEQPEYGYLSTEFVHGKKPKWNVGDVLAYYICTSNEEGEYPLGKIVNVEFDEEDGWVYTFDDESTWDEQSLFEEDAYKKN